MWADGYRRYCEHFYPRPPRGGRRSRKGDRRKSPSISTHALREEGDVRYCGQFFPRVISTHALREEGDAHHTRDPVDKRDFYPRPPRGGRPGTAKPFTRRRNFYPRPPRGGRHGEWEAYFNSQSISTHALREEGDLGFRLEWKSIGDFYPRPPRGGRHHIICNTAIEYEFLPTPSARRATLL